MPSSVFHDESPFLGSDEDLETGWRHPDSIPKGGIRWSGIAPDYDNNRAKFLLRSDVSNPKQGKEVWTEEHKNQIRMAVSKKNTTLNKVAVQAGIHGSHVYGAMGRLYSVNVGTFDRLMQAIENYDPALEPEQDEKHKANRPFGTFPVKPRRKTRRTKAKNGSSL